MENVCKDRCIRVKNKFVDYVKRFAENDSLLSSVLQLKRIEDHVPENDEPFTYFDVKFVDVPPSKFTISEIQVSTVLFTLFHELVEVMN